jgi:short-subunit dehydrogenase
VATSFASRWPCALVTGASSGIGRAFATELVRKGSRVVAVARRKERLEALAAEAPPDSVEVLVADLSAAEGLEMVEARLSDRSRPVDLLVNNAGIGGSGPFVRLDVDRHDLIVRLNVLAPVRLTSAALPRMVERGRGGVINVSSIAGVQPVPYLATYAASKAFVSTFSQSLHEEVRHLGVTVVALLPGEVRTEFHDSNALDRSSVPEAAWLSAEEVAEAGLDALAARRAVSVPGLGYKALVSVSRLAPWWLNRKVAAAIGRHL